MKTPIKLILLFSFILMSPYSFAQGCDSDDPADSSEPPKIKIFGYLQPEYNYTLSDPAESTFAFRRARIGVRGKFQDFGYYFMMETSPFIGGVGSAYLMDAFVSWEKYNWARVALGSYKQPFGREVVKACWDLTTIDRAIVSDQLVSPQRDYGIMLLGGNKYNRFNYRVAVMNGRGLNVKDNNNKKDFIGRATYQVFDFLNIGASFRYGFPNNDTDNRITYGGDFLIDLNNLHIQGEYIYDQGDYNRAAGGGCGSEPLELGEKRAGAYGMIWYDTKWNIQPVFKYEFFDQDFDIKGPGYQERMTIGLNYFVGRMFRIQLNYQANIETYINKKNDKFLAQVQIRW